MPRACHLPASARSVERDALGRPRIEDGKSACATPSFPPDVPRRHVSGRGQAPAPLASPYVECGGGWCMVTSVTNNLGNQSYQEFFANGWKSPLLSRKPKTLFPQAADTPTLSSRPDAPGAPFPAPLTVPLVTTAQFAGPTSYVSDPSSSSSLLASSPSDPSPLAAGKAGLKGKRQHHAEHPLCCMGRNQRRCCTAYQDCFYDLRALLSGVST